MTPGNSYTVVVGAAGTGATKGGGAAAGGNGRVGAVRVVWAVAGVRGTPSFPSTNVGP